VAAQVVLTTSTGDSARPQIGGQLIISVELIDKTDAKIGTGVGVCTLVLPSEMLQQCLNTAAFAEGHIIFGGSAPLPSPGAVVQFGILGGTEKFCKGQGEAVLVITPTGDIDSTCELDLPGFP
jgi:hypothetical protein